MNKTVEMNKVEKTTLMAKVEAKSIEFNNLVAKTTNNEQKLQNASIVLIEQIVELCHLNINNKLSLYPNKDNKESVYTLLDLIVDNIYNSTVDNGMSKYSKEIIFGLISAIKNNPDDMIRNVLTVEVYTISLSNFKKLLDLVKKVGEPQNQELPEYKWTFKNISTKKGTFIFEKSPDVLDFEERLKNGVQYSTNPSKIVKSIIKHRFGGDKPTSIEQIEELVMAFKDAMIESLNSQVAETVEAIEPDVVTDEAIAA